MEHCKTCKRWKKSKKFGSISEFGHICEFEHTDDESNWTYYLIPPGIDHSIVFMPGPDYGCVHHVAKEKSDTSDK